jgi:transketolase
MARVKMRNNLQEIKRSCILTLLTLYKKANAGHIGSSLSCLDILIYLYFKQLNSTDKFVLSKGHAAASLYTVLAKAGRIKKELLDSFYLDGTFLAAHPPCNREIKEIIFGTGSLGHGLSLSSGLALASKFTHKKYNVYTILSDGDCDEGSTWEAALFASQHKLNNLIAIIDNNGLQGFGRTSDVLDLESLVDKWKSFNFEVYTAENGNDFSCLEKTFKQIDFNNEKPKCIIARTTKGNSVSYMENKLEWHYLPMSDEQYQQAMKENQ